MNADSDGSAASAKNDRILNQLQGFKDEQSRSGKSY